MVIHSPNNKLINPHSTCIAIRYKIHLQCKSTECFKSHTNQVRIWD